jgi:hypothetical protein
MQAESAHFLAVLRADDAFMPQFPAIEAYFKNIEFVVSVAVAET